MEQLNRIQLRGIVGSVRVSDISGKKVARITLATNYAYKTQDGCVVIETTWHSFVALEKPEFPPLDTLKRGDAIYIEGRLRQQRYTDNTGSEHTITEVIASKLERVNEPLTMEC